MNGKRGRITCRQDVFNFWTYFKPLLKAKKPGLRLSFIPFKQGGSDPFQDLMTTIGASQNQPWRNCTSRHFNRSPGIRSAWMARLLNQKLKEHKITNKSIDNSSHIILQEEQQRGWKDPAFWGYSNRLKNQAVKHFKADNNKFAKAAWEISWSTLFPVDSQPKPRKKQIYQPQSIEEEETMHSIAIHLLNRIRHEIHPNFASHTADPLERITSFLSPSVTLQAIRHIKSWRKP